MNHGTNMHSWWFFVAFHGQSELRLFSGQKIDILFNCFAASGLDGLLFTSN